jgi:hypothetical protein
MIYLNKYIFFTSLGLFILENFFLIFKEEINLRRFFSFVLSLLLVNIFYKIKDKNYYLPFHLFIFFLLLLYYQPIQTIIYSSEGVPLPVVISLISILLNIMNRYQNLSLTLTLLSLIIFIGFYFENRTLVVSIMLFIIFKLTSFMAFKKILKIPIFYSIIFPIGSIFLIMYIGSLYQNFRLLGLRDYIWSVVLFGEEFSAQFYITALDAYKNLDYRHFIESNVHSNFVGLFSRLHIITAISSLGLLHILVKHSFKSHISNWRVQFSLFILINQSLFSGRSFFSLDDLSIVWWLGFFGIVNQKKKSLIT